LARLHAACMAVRPFTRWSGRKWRSACNRRVVACTARALRLGSFSPGPACMTCGTQPPRRGRGENLGVCWRRLNPQRLRTQVGIVVFKRGATPLEADHVLRAPLMHRAFPSSEPPGWGMPAVLLSCRRRNATSWKLVPLSHRLASRIFIMQPGCIPSPVVTQDGDHQRLGGEEQTRLRPPPRPRLQGSSSSLLGQRVRRVEGPPPRGSVTLFFPRCLGEKGVFQLRGGFPQPRRGRRTAAARPGCSIPSSVRTMVAPRAGRPRPSLPRADSRVSGSPSTSCVARAALMFWAAPARARTCRCALRRPAPAGAVLRRWRPEKASLPTRLPTPPAPLGLRLPA
jgi:hypothetical protein